jgi:hypothetical protein
MYFSKSSFNCFRFIFWGTTAIDAREELEELDEERDLGFGRDGRLLTLFSSSDEEEDELRDLLPLLVVVTKAWLTEWLEETGGG